MGTRLEQLQAAAKAKTAAGQPITAKPISTPQVSTPAVSTPAVATSTAPVKAPVTTPSYGSAPGLKATAPVGAMAAITAGLPKQTTPTATQTATQTATPSTPTTNYVAQGGKTLNDILYLKQQYEGGKTGAAAYATPLYNSLDPQTAALVKGMDASKLKAYITGQSGQGTPTTSTTTPTATQFDPYAAATAAYTREQAMMDAAAAANVKELERRNDYSMGVTRDNRTLEDASFYRNNVPTAWDGSTGYQAAMQDRNRSIADTYTAQGLADAEAAAWSQANAFRNQSGNYVTERANELSNQERQYNLQEAGLTGMLNGQQTMQGAANAAQLVSQNIANQIAQIDLSTYPEQSALKLQQLQQQVQSGKISNDAAAYQLTQLTDPNSTTNQAAALDLAMKQIDASNYSEAAKLQLEQLRKTVAQIGAVQPTTEYERRIQELDLEKAALQVENLRAEGNKTVAGKTYEDYQSAIEKLAVRDDKTGELKNPKAVETYITNSDMSLYQKYRAWVSSGLQWPANVEIPSPGE